MREGASSSSIGASSAPSGRACGILRVSKSEYYDYVKEEINAQIEREALEGFVAERFDLHKGRYGYRRINRGSGATASSSAKRVLAVMRKLGLQAKGRAGSTNARRRSRWATRA